MIVGTVLITLYAPWVHSLKEKRMVVRSLLTKVRSRFNVSAIEAEEQDTHQTVVLGIACAAGSTALGDSMIDNVISFVESNTEAEITRIEREVGPCGFQG